MAWRFFDFQNYNIFENMAIDEAVFRETIKNKKKPTIRFYGSNPAAVTIGYFQDAKKDLNLERCHCEGIDIVRRITGGRAVFHRNEITYSVTAGNDEKVFPDNIPGTYRVIGRCLLRGLRDLGIDARLAEKNHESDRTQTVSCCFATPAKNEILVDNRKICGSAKVRKQGGFLQHGLLFYDFDPVKTTDLLQSSPSSERVKKLRQSVTAVNEELVHPLTAWDICVKLKKSFCEELGIDLEEGTLTPAEEKLKDELMAKYTDVNWNIERKKYFKAVG
jgi:lipoate-protein ligase A